MHLRAKDQSWQNWNSPSSELTLILVSEGKKKPRTLRWEACSVDVGEMHTHRRQGQCKATDGVQIWKFHKTSPKGNLS